MGLPPLTPGSHDERLLETLRPPSWCNPDPPDRYHLLVIGGGTAGLVTAAIAAALGARTGLVERALMGGDCLNVGCVPSKALLAAARSWEQAARSAADFDGPGVAGAGDFGAVMDRMRRIRADIAAHDSPTRFRELGVDVWLGEAAFSGRDSVRVDGRELRFRRAVIATGTRPAVPGIRGLETAAFLTNESIFSLQSLPEHLAVIGAGPIGAELGQAFRRFGSRVTLLEAADRMLPAEDPEAGAVVADALRAEGIRVVAEARISSVRDEGARCAIRFRSPAGEEELDCDRLLLSCGRVPNVEGIGLEKAGVEYDPAAGVTVDDRLRTTNPRIYAAGDVVGPLRFTHLADAHARLVVRNALFHGRSRTSRLVVPWCTYTSPELAHVGIPYPELEGRADRLRSVTVPFAEVDRAKLDGATSGFLRLHLAAGSDRIAAATVVGPGAGEIVSQLAMAMQGGVGLEAIGNTIHPYPSYSEIVRKAADVWRRGKLTPVARRAFSAYFGFLRT